MTDRHPLPLETSGPACASTSPRADINAEWKERVMDRGGPVSASAMALVLRPLMQAMLDAGPSGVDFLGLDPERVNGLLLAVALRATFQHRRDIVGWDRGLAVSFSCCERDGLDPRSALCGLLDQPPANFKRAP